MHDGKINHLEVHAELEDIHQFPKEEIISLEPSVWLVADTISIRSEKQH